MSAAMIGIKKTDTDSKADFNSGQNEMAGLVVVAAAVPEAPTEGGAVMMTTDGLISVAKMIDEAKLLVIATSTFLVLRSQKPKASAQN